MKLDEESWSDEEVAWDRRTVIYSIIGGVTGAVLLSVGLVPALGVVTRLMLPFLGVL